MIEPNHAWMLGLDLVAVVVTARIFLRDGAPPAGVAFGVAGALGWLWALHLALTTRAPFPAPGLPFMALILAAVGGVGVVLALPPVRRVLAQLADASLLDLQSVRLLFGATFAIQGLTGALPTAFGLLDGATHLTAGALAVGAAAAARRSPGSPSATTRAWAANLFGLADILVVATTLAFLLLPQITAHHPMMLAVFLPAPFWLWWHVLSLARLVRRPALAEAR